MTVLVTRIAPTPSGYLHVGNALNMVLTHWLARARGGRLLLRIDDFDTGRARATYLEDVFRTLDWLRIDIDAGPSGPADFHSSWSMSTRIDQFRRARDQLMAGDHDSVFVCRCSRHALDPTGRCVAGCRERDLALEPGRTALRMSVPAGSARGLPLPAGDHVLWRRDDLPAYQLGSVVADEDLAVTAIVRGVDLLGVLRPAAAPGRDAARAGLHRGRPAPPRAAGRPGRAQAQQERRSPGPSPGAHPRAARAGA